MKKELVDVRSYGHDWKKLAQDILGVSIGKEGWEPIAEGITFSSYGYGGLIPGISMGFRDERDYTVKRSVRVVAFTLDATKLKARFQELKKLLVPVAERKAEIVRERQTNRDRLQQVASEAELPIDSIQEIERDGQYLYNYRVFHLTVAQLVAIGKALKTEREG